MNTLHTRTTRRAFVLGAAGAAFVVSTAVAKTTADQSTPAAACATPGATPALHSQAIPATPSASQHIVEMTNKVRFSPDTLKIKVGESVTWKNTSQMAHTTTCDPAKNPVAKTQPDLISLPKGADTWDSGLLDPDKEYSHQFNQVGEYHYVCLPHALSGMKGTIIVEC